MQNINVEFGTIFIGELGIGGLVGRALSSGSEDPGLRLA